MYIPFLSGNVTEALRDTQAHVKQMSDDSVPFWTSVFSWIKGDW